MQKFVSEIKEVISKWELGELTDYELYNKLWDVVTCIYNKL